MANEIDLIIGKVAFSQITDMIVKLQDLDTKIKASAEIALGLDNALKGIKSTAGLDKNIELNKALNVQIKELAANYSKVSSALNSQLLTQQKILESNTRMANSTAALVLKQEAAIERKSAKETAAINKKIQEEEKANKAIQVANEKRLKEEERIQKAILTAAEKRIKEETLAEDLKNKKAALASKLRADVEQAFARNTANTLRRLNEESAARMQGNATAQVGMFSRMRQGLSSLMQLFGVYSAMMLAHRAIMGTIRFEKKLSDDVAQLAIYLDNSTENATKLVGVLSQIKTRTSLEDLIGLGSIVAKKGVAQEEIGGIVKALDDLFLVLGEGLGSKEEATASIVKLISIFNTDGKITAERVTDMGKSLTYLTTSGVATGEYLIDFAERLGAVRSITGQSKEEILGLGAAYEQLGITSTVASTAVGQVIKKLLTDVPKYAKQAGINVNEFRYLLETNSTEAFVRYAEGLGRITKNHEQLSIEVAKANFQGQRLSAVVIETATQYELIREKVTGATNAVLLNAKEIADSSLKQKTFAATLANVGKEFQLILASKRVTDFFNDLAVNILGLTKAIFSIPFSAIKTGLITWAAWKTIVNFQLIKSAALVTLNNLGIAKQVVLTTAANLGIGTQTFLQKNNNAALAEKILLSQEAIAIENLKIATLTTEIAVLEADTLANQQNALVNAEAILVKRGQIVASEAIVAANIAVVTSTEATTAAVAATPWGALAVVIGVAVMALISFVNKEDDAITKAKELLDLKDKAEGEMDKLKSRRDKDQKDKEARIANDNLLESKQKGYSKKQQEAALKEEKDNRDRSIAGNISYWGNIKNNSKNALDKLKEDRAKDAANLKKLNEDQEKSLKTGGAANAARLKVSAEREINKREEERKKREIVLSQQYTKALDFETEAVKKRDANVKIAPNAETGVMPTGAVKRERANVTFDEVKSEYDYKKAVIDTEVQILNSVDKEKMSFEDRLKNRQELSVQLKKIIDLEEDYETKSSKQKYDDAIAKNALSVKNGDTSAAESAKNKIDIQNTYDYEIKTIAEKTKQKNAQLQVDDLNFTIDIANKKLQLTKDVEQSKLEASSTAQKLIADDAVKNERYTAKQREAAFQEWLSIEKKKLELTKALETAKNTDSKGNIVNLQTQELINAEYEKGMAILNNTKSVFENINEETRSWMKQFSDKTLDESLGNLGLQSAKIFLKMNGESQSAFMKMYDAAAPGFEKFKVAFNAIAEASQGMFNKMAEMSQAHYESDYRRLEAQKEQSLKFAGDSAVAKEKIEADYAKKKKEIEKRQFEDEKKISMVNIVIDTAQGVMATIGKTGFFGSPLAMLVAAMGAVQLGMVAAQQFPAYAEGTDNHRGGMMLVNDGAGANFQEKVILPSGKVIRPQGRNVLMNAPKGTKVLNHEQQLFEMLQSNNISMPSNNYQGMTSDEMDEILGKHFSNIKTQNTIFDKNGFQSYVRNGNSITRSNSNRSQAIGISV